MQVHEGKSGYIVDPEDTVQFAQRMFELSTDDAKYGEMAGWAGELGKTYNYREFSTVANAIRWLEVYNGVLDGHIPGGRRWRLSEIVDGEMSPETTALRQQIGSLAV